jgi:signal transduction histidine kinase
VSPPDAPQAGSALRVPRRAAEAMLVAGVAFVQVVGTTGAAQGQPGRDPLDTGAYLLLLAGPALLLLRRRHPVAALAAVLAVAAVYYGVGYPYGPAFLSVVVALWSAVLAGHRVAAWTLGASGIAAYFALAWALDGRTPTLAAVAGHVAWLLVVLSLAEVVRVSRGRLAEERRAAEEERRRRASEERLRLVRELHDALGHHVSLITVQASVALHLMDRQPEQARTALEAIKAASKELLGETRTALDVLRGDDEHAPRGPAPGLDRLPDLVARCAAGGLHVTVTTEGTAALDAATDRTAYRIVQEALTNVLRHAGTDTAAVHLDRGEDALVVAVTDDGRGPAAPAGREGATDQAAPDGGAGTSGLGLVGMRERAAALGGRLTAGPRPGGGFAVTATLPRRDDPAAPAAPRVDVPDARDTARGTP